MRCHWSESPKGEFGMLTPCIENGNIKRRTSEAHATEPRGLQQPGLTSQQFWKENIYHTSILICLFDWDIR